MATERTLPMRVVELQAEGWVSAMDFVDALKRAIGAPDWHGNGIDAFLDSMICHDEMNALKSPYTIRINGAGKAGAEAYDMMRQLAALLGEHGASDRGGDLEVTLLVEE
jgi:Barstar (barnase inhibitor)